MPYFYDPNLDQENQNQNQSTNGTSINISGASPSIDSNASGQPQGASTGSSQGLNTGSGFTNLDKYLQTNNSQDFGNKFLGKVSDQVSNAQTQMTDAANSFTNKVQNSNTLPTMDQVNSAIANPTSADATQFQKWEKQTYTGPQSLSGSQDDWNKYWSGVQQAQTNTQLLGNDAGRFTLLNQYFGRPSYNYGEESLDNLLFQQSGLGNQTKALQDQATQLQSQGVQQANQLQGVASQKAADVEQNRNQILSAIGLDQAGNVLTGDSAGAIGKQYADVQSQVDKTNADRAAQVAAVKQGLASDNLTNDQLLQLGLTPGQNIYNLDLSQYLTPGANLDKDQVMTPEQRSYIQALSQLAGVTDTFASTAAIDKTNPYSYNTGAFQDAINGAKTAYQYALQNTPIAVPSVYTPGRSGNSISLGMAEQMLAQAKEDIAKGSVLNAQPFIDLVTPLIAQAHQNIDNQFQVNRTLSDPGPLKLPGGGPTIYGRLPGQ